jgi:uncharacterized pyridoxal phosphate-containing UPF0001 family protein
MLVKGVLPYGKLIIETVGSTKVCDKLDRAMSDFEGNLPVFVQVNTSGEDAKAGVTPEEAIELSRYIVEDCDRLELMGLMTIGMWEDRLSLRTLRILRD